MVVRSKYVKHFFVMHLVLSFFVYLPFLGVIAALVHSKFMRGRSVIVLVVLFLIYNLIAILKELIFHWKEVEVSGGEIIFTSYFNRKRSFELGSLYEISTIENNKGIIAYSPQYYFKTGEKLVFTGEIDFKKLASLRRESLNSDEKLTIIRQGAFFNTTEEQL